MLLLTLVCQQEALCQLSQQVLPNVATMLHPPVVTKSPLDEALCLVTVQALEARLPQSASVEPVVSPASIVVALVAAL